MLVWPGKTQMLFTASSRNWYSTPCASPCPDPRRTMSMKMPHATLKAVSAARSLLPRMVSRISCQVSRSSIGRPRVRVLDPPVAQADDPPGHAGDVALVGHDHDRHPLGVDLLQELHDLDRRG